MLNIVMQMEVKATHSTLNKRYDEEIANNTTRSHAWKCSEEHRCFEGWQQRWRHDSSTLNCPMTLGYLSPPPQITLRHQCCTGFRLTCNDENFTTKAGAQRVAAELGIVLVMPDTSPRGEKVANDDGYDLGQGAGCYLNATQPPWATHYRMYDYLRDELPALVQSQFNVSDRRAISGHSWVVTVR